MSSLNSTAATGFGCLGFRVWGLGFGVWGLGFRAPNPKPRGHLQLPPAVHGEEQAENDEARTTAMVLAPPFV